MLENIQGPNNVAVVAGPVTVPIDIKPGSFPNSVNPRSSGTIPVAVLSSGTFNASTIAVETVRFGATGSEAVAVAAALEDVNQDGLADMVFHFRTPDTGIVCGTKSASLTGTTVGGTAIMGTDSVKTTACK